MKTHIIITGGSGFLGKEICRQASRLNTQVVSLSRSGKPRQIKNVDFATVTWVKGDVFDHAVWDEYLPDCRGIIHCIGILHEQPEKGITYKREIFETAQVIGLIAKTNGINDLVYVSAGAAAPGTPDGYMKNKLEAENFLQSLNLHLTILKPGMLYGPDLPETLIENDQVQKLLLDPKIRPHLYPHRPLPVSSVAQVALEAVLNTEINGKLSVDDIERLAANG